MTAEQFSRKDKTMKAKVEIKKSFDDGKVFNKEWEHNDFREFFEGEGDYLDNLSAILFTQGKTGDKFTVTYTVTVTK